MDTLEKLLDEWEKDSNMNPTEPGKELLKIPKLQGKYIKAFSNSKLRLKNAKDAYAECKKLKWNYYSGNYNTNKEMLQKLGLEPFKFILKQDISIYLDSDKELVEASKKITYYEEMSKACELILGELKQRTWQLKSYIDWEKFIAGV